MSRSTFDAGHFCSKVNKEIEFRVLIGDPIVCPLCQEIIVGEIIVFEEAPFFTQKETDKNKFVLGKETL